ncbi:MAG TPA: hypothetical protein VFD02_07010 [Syntrophomonadaceae bacterium]|nr:hypothetical protein [Syntrophomonadaceae bacterium]
MPKVLFSTLGMTDPIKNDYDGPLLHIMRKYRPEKVYLFMTKRICELSDEDARYRVQIQYLCAHEGFICEVIELRYAYIDNPQEYDIFYPLFEKELKEIHINNPDAQILVNLSSGTPQMKSTCHLLALTMPFPIIPLQVTTPHERENYGSPNYDIEETWNNNMDNYADLATKNRTTAVKAENLTYLMLREVAISNIETYNYSAALNELMPVQAFAPPKVIGLLKAAIHRKNMELKEAEKESNSVGYDIFPIKSGDAKDLFEYLLLLGLQQKSGQLMDFVRGISPALTRLFESFLKENCRRQIRQDFCVRYADEHWRIKRDKLAAREPDLLAYYDTKYGYGFRDSDISCASLLPMIEYDCRPRGRSPNEALIKRAQKMRTVEEKVRNPAAHSITAVTEEQFEKLAGITSDRLLADMQWMFQMVYRQYFPVGVNLWDSYTKMNEDIIDIILFE